MNATNDLMENLRKRIHARLANNKKDFLKYTSQPTHVTHKIFGKDYAAVHEIKPVLILNKTIYVGFTVLDLSKWKMYNFHYNFIKKKLILTQTVLFMKSVFKQKDLFDFINYSKDSKFFNETNKKFIGKMKDIVSEFV